MTRPLVAFGFVWAVIFAPNVLAGPTPQLQKRITAALAAAAQAQANGTKPDWSTLVNPFVGTDADGDVCPGASVPFGMAKFSVDMTGYAPAGYIVNPAERVRGISPLHDSGTGSSLGSYGNFEVMPSICPDGFYSCVTNINTRLKHRKNYTDDASPGYFTTTLENEIKIEATSTRRAGIERFTFPPGVKPYFVLDLANDLPASFGGGVMDIHPDTGTIQLGGRWKPSFGPSYFFYEAYSCYKLSGDGQTLDEYGAWTADNYGMDAKEKGLTHLNLSINLIGSSPYQSGALFSYSLPSTNTSSPTITLRVGTSFISADQACSNLDEEVGDASFEDIVSRSKTLWNEKLGRIELDLNAKGSDHNVTEMFYTSLYRSFLTPNNATLEAQGKFSGTSSPYFDSLYCSWDTFRTFYPLLSLHSPQDYADIVENYIDGWRKNGFLPECRSNNLPGWTQGGSDATNILADFAVKYHNEAAALGVDINELYEALRSDGEVTPPEWNIQGRQIGVYKQHGYVPFAVLDPSSTGRQTREGSRTLEYAFNDFAIRQVALLLGQTEDVVKYTNRSYWYRNVWDPSVVSDGFKGNVQKRYPNGTFHYNNPTDCSPADTSTTRECSLTQGNMNGFYESSAWEYQFFAPHDTAHLIEVMGGTADYIKRLDHFFDANYYLAGNEPSFQTPLGYHYANAPTRSVDRVREVVYENFDITPAGLPGNDDQGAMATLLAFHLLGIYPVPSTTQYLIVSPFIPKYTIHNPYLNVSTIVITKNFDSKSLSKTIPSGTRAYVKSVTFNSQPASRCHFDFYDVFKKGGELVIEVTADKAGVNDCGGSLPDSLSTGGWSKIGGV